MCSIAIFLLSDVVIKVLVGLKSNIPSGDSRTSADIFRIFSLLPILVLAASMLTVQGMYGLQLQRYAPYIGGAICLFSLAVNYLFIKNIGIQGAAFSYVAIRTQPSTQGRSSLTSGSRRPSRTRATR